MSARNTHRRRAFSRASAHCICSPGGSRTRIAATAKPWPSLIGPWARAPGHRVDPALRGGRRGRWRRAGGQRRDDDSVLGFVRAQSSQALFLRGRTAERAAAIEKNRGLTSVMGMRIPADERRSEWLRLMLALSVLSKARHEDDVRVIVEDMRNTDEPEAKLIAGRLLATWDEASALATRAPVPAAPRIDPKRLAELRREERDLLDALGTSSGTLRRVTAVVDVNAVFDLLGPGDTFVEMSLFPSSRPRFRRVSTPHLPRGVWRADRPR